MHPDIEAADPNQISAPWEKGIIDFSNGSAAVFLVCLAEINDVMKAKTILSAVFTALCLVFCILEWDLAMFLTGFIALIIIGFDDVKLYFRFFRKMTRKICTMRSIRKEVVEA